MSRLAGDREDGRGGLMPRKINADFIFIELSFEAAELSRETGYV